MEHVGVYDCTYYQKVFSKAWNNHHSEGLSDVALAFEDLLEFLETLEGLPH